jgi:hypothetical protein
VRLYVTKGLDDRIVRHIPVDELAVPRRVSSADVVVVDLRLAYDDPDRVVIASQAATIDPTDLEIVVDAGPSTTHPTRISLDDTAGLDVGRTYLLESPGALTEPLTIRHIDGDNHMVYAEHEIRHPFPAGSRLIGLELGVEILSVVNTEDGEQDEGGPYGVIWTYEIGDQTYHPIDDLYIRRHSLPAWCREPDVLQAYPRLARRTRESFEVTQAIASATSQTKAELELAGVKPETITSDVLREVVVCRSISLCLRWLRSNDSPSDEDDIAYYEKRADVLTRSLLNGQPPVRTADVPSNGDATGPRRLSYDEIFRRG